MSKSMKPSAADKFFASMIQKHPEEIEVDMEKGDIFYGGEYCGTMNRKFIPFRRCWEREFRNTIKEWEKTVRSEYEMLVRNLVKSYTPPEQPQPSNPLASMKKFYENYQR